MKKLDDRRRLGRALKAAGLPMGARYAAMVIWGHRNRQTGYAMCGVPAVADIVGADERETRRLIRQVEETGILRTTPRVGSSSMYFFPEFPAEPRVLSTPGTEYPPGVETPRVPDAPGIDGPPGVVLPPTPGVGHPPNSFNKVLAAAAAADSPGSKADAPAGAGPDIDDPHLVILRGKLSGVGLVVRWDRLTTDEVAAIVQLVQMHGDDPLVKAAQQSRVAHGGSPPAYAKAWIPVWKSLPAPGQRLAVVPAARSACTVPGHGGEPAASCSRCHTRDQATFAAGLAGLPRRNTRPDRSQP